MEKNDDTHEGVLMSPGMNTYREQEYSLEQWALPKVFTLLDQRQSCATLKKTVSLRIAEKTWELGN